VAAVEKDLAEHDVDVPVYWGNRNWHPYLADTLARMRDDGIGRVAAFVTSAYSSYSGCRQYREDLAAASAAVGPDAPRIDRLRHYFNHPGFVAANVAGAVEALATVPVGSRLVFVTHSIPTAMAETSGPAGGAYEAQHRATAAVVASGVAARTGARPSWDLVYCSRSGSPLVPWLEPDVNDHLETLVDRGVAGVVLAPIGFVSDHMEVVYDLDLEAKARALELGLNMVRAATVGTHPRFVAMIRELIVERAEAAALRLHLGTRGCAPDECPQTCCLVSRSGA
jgi:ferrochelatase